MIDHATKRCNRCGEEKPLSAYGLQSNSPDGHRYTCKACISAKNKALRQNRVAAFDPSVIPETKECGTCNKVKPSSRFSPDKASKDGLFRDCHVCCRDRSNRRMFKVRSANFTVTVTSKACGCCERELPPGKFWRSTRTADNLSIACKDCRGKDKFVEVNEKLCRYCKTIRGKDEFNFSAVSKDRMQSYCRICHACHKYAISREEFDEILDAQGGTCAICGYLFFSKQSSKGYTDVVIDHCHSTGEVRGLLCRGCNTAIGLLGDTPEGVARAVNYLLRNPQEVCHQ